MGFKVNAYQPSLVFALKSIYVEYTYSNYFIVFNVTQTNGASAKKVFIFMKTKLNSLGGLDRVESLRCLV
jgi:hypothetical protein